MATAAKPHGRCHYSMAETAACDATSGDRPARRDGIGKAPREPATRALAWAVLRLNRTFHTISHLELVVVKALRFTRHFILGCPKRNPPNTTGIYLSCQ